MGSLAQNVGIAVDCQSGTVLRSIQGRPLYQATCAVCHGSHGEGSDRSSVNAKYFNRETLPKVRMPIETALFQTLALTCPSDPPRFFWWSRCRAVASCRTRWHR